MFASFTTQARCLYYLTVNLNLLKLVRMLPFFSTFISGLGELVGRWLQEDLLNVKIDALSDGLVIFETGTSSHDVGKIRYLNNCFVLISKYGSTQLITDVSAAVGFLLRDKGIGGKLRQLGAIKGGSFKVIFSSENRTVSVDRDLLARLERLIIGETGLRPVRFGAGREFWLITRHDGIVLFGLRITPLKKKTEEGELRLELANILCHLSGPGKSDVFLDPFCGSGSIFLERISSFPYKMAFAFDNNVEKIKILEKKVSWTKEKIKIRVGNALGLFDIEAGLVDKIITDPPWGHFQAVEDVDEFYRRMAKEFSRVLKPGGIAVILVAREIEFDRFISEFKLLEKYQILVSGKKASIFKFLRA